MKDSAADIFRDATLLTFAGLGLSAYPIHTVVGGLFLALAGAALARHIWREESQGEFWFTIALAGFFAVVAAAAAGHWLPEAKPPVVPQMVMAGIGFFSRPLAVLIRQLTRRLVARADHIADRALDRMLPPDE